MANIVKAIIYNNGRIENGDNGVTFVCLRPKLIIFEENINLDELKQVIKNELRLCSDQIVSEIIYRLPLCFTPLQYGSLYLENETHLRFMIDTYRQYVEKMNLIELYVYTVSGLDLNMSTDAPCNEGQNSLPMSYPEFYTGTSSVLETQVHANVYVENQPRRSSQLLMDNPLVDQAIDRDIGESDEEDLDYVPTHEEQQNVDSDDDLISLAQSSDNVIGDVVPLSSTTQYQVLGAQLYSQIDVDAAHDTSFHGDYQVQTDDLYVGRRFPDKASLCRLIKMNVVRSHCTFKCYKSNKDIGALNSPVGIASGGLERPSNRGQTSGRLQNLVSHTSVWVMENDKVTRI